MCGIVGAFMFGDINTDVAQEKIRQEAVMFMTTELLQQTQSRGEDATGVATLFDNGMYIGLKSGIAASKFIMSMGEKETDYQGYLKLWRNKVHAKQHRYARIHIGHCRKSSVGNSVDNNNNHPIVVDPIIGIHNGTLKNHDIIFEKLDCNRIGSVDSEAIMQLVHYYTKKGKLPFTAEMIKEVGQRLDGSFATIIMNANNPYQVALMKDLRPIELLLVRPLNLVIVASEAKFLEVMLFRYNKHVALYANNDWPILKKSDVVTKSLANDDVVVFDLTKEITNDTDITDLYDHDKIVFNQKKWKATYTSSYYSGYGHTYNSKKKATTGYYTRTKTNAKTNETTTKHTETKGAKTKGRVWNKKEGKFTTVAEDTKNTGTVTVDVTTGTVTPLLRKVENAEKQIVGTTPDVNISKIDNKTSKDKTKTNTPVEETPMTTVEVDMNINTEALEESIHRAEKIKYYTTDEEVANDLELAKPSVLKNLPAVALANRIKKFIYKIAFYDGYCAGSKKAESTSKKDKNRPDMKDRKREKNIRVLKAMAKTLAQITDSLATEATIQDTLQSMEKNAQLSVAHVKNVLKEGDIRDNLTLKKFMEWISEE